MSLPTSNHCAGLKSQSKANSKVLSLTYNSKQFSQPTLANCSPSSIPDHPLVSVFLDPRLLLVSSSTRAMSITAMSINVHLWSDLPPELCTLSFPRHH